MRYLMYIAVCLLCLTVLDYTSGQQLYTLSVPDGETTYNCGVYIDVVVRDGNRSYHLPIDDDLVILNKNKNVFLTVYLHGVEWDSRLSGNAKGYINRKSFRPVPGLDLRMSDAGRFIELPDWPGGSRIPVTFEVVSSKASDRLVIPLWLESSNFRDKRKQRVIGLDYMITNKPDVAQWQTIKGTNDPGRMRQFIAAFPESEHITLAVSHLRNLDYEAWGATLKQSPEALRKYLRSYPEGQYAEEARSILSALSTTIENTVTSPATTPPPESSAETAEEETVNEMPAVPADERRWNGIRSQHNKDSLLAFIAQYPRSIYADAAQRALEDLMADSDAQLSYQITMDGEWFVVKLINAQSPVIDFDYLDYVTQVNAIWDTSRLAEEHVCRVRFQNEGEYEVIFNDRWQQPLYVTLANILQASCEVGDDNNYHISITGGKPPFRVLLREPRSSITSYAKEKCETRSVTLEMRDLLRNRLKGKYNVIVKDRTSATVELESALSISSSFRIHPVIWLIAVGLVLFGAWRYIMRRVKSPKTIFDSR
jgi:hypothetical protein